MCLTLIFFYIQYDSSKSNVIYSLRVFEHFVVACVFAFVLCVFAFVVTYSHLNAC